jgi:hypothetical protein
MSRLCGAAGVWSPMKNAEIAILIGVLGAVALLALVHYGMPSMTPKPIPPAVVTQPAP